MKQSNGSILGPLVLRSSPAGSDNYELKPKYKKGSNKKKIPWLEDNEKMERQSLPTLIHFIRLFTSLIELPTIQSFS